MEKPPPEVDVGLVGMLRMMMEEEEERGKGKGEIDDAYEVTW